MWTGPKKGALGIQPFVSLISLPRAFAPHLAKPDRDVDPGSGTSGVPNRAGLAQPGFACHRPRSGRLSGRRGLGLPPTGRAIVAAEARERRGPYKASSARFLEPSSQQRLFVQAAEIGRGWSELSAARMRAVLTAFDRSGRRAGRSGRHPPAPDTARRHLRCRCCTLAGRTERGNPDLVRAGTATQSRDGNQDADRRNRSVRRGETRPAIDQAARQGATVQRDSRRERRRPLFGACRARRSMPILFHSGGPPQLSRPGHHPGDTRRAPTARPDGREVARPLPPAWQDQRTALGFA